MQPKNNPSERGQAIVLIVLAIIALLGFTALAVDGSLVYADRRWAQNAADASALAGAGAAAQYLENQLYHYYVGSPWDSGTACTGVAGTAAQIATAAAIARASENDHTLTVADGGVAVECGREGALKYMDVTVVVTETTDTAFAQVVFPGGLQNTVTAVSRVIPSTEFAWGRSIVALNPNIDNCNSNQDGMQFFGLNGCQANNGRCDDFYGSLFVDQGGIWSNGCMDVDNNNASVVINNGAVEYFENANNYSLDAITISPYVPPTNFDEDVDPRLPVESYTIPFPVGCNNPDNVKDPREFLDIAAAGPLSGLYCIDSTRRNGERLTISARDQVIGTNVTIVLLNGDLKIEGGATVNLTALPTEAIYNGGAIPGMLFYVPPPPDPGNTNCTSSCISIEGGPGVTLKGTILAPGEDATITFSGTSDSTIEGQIIGWNVDIGGDSGTMVNHDSSRVSTTPTYLNMQK